MSIKDFIRNISHQHHIAVTIGDLAERIKDNMTAQNRPTRDRGTFLFKMEEDVAEDVISWGEANDVTINRLEVGQFFVSF